MNVFRTLFKIKTNEHSKRVQTLDFLRGVLILLVLYHHSGAPFSSFVLQFHMPALFVLSGYTEFFINKQKPFVSYVKSKFCAKKVQFQRKLSANSDQIRYKFSA